MSIFESSAPVLAHLFGIPPELLQSVTGSEVIEVAIIWYFLKLAITTADEVKTLADAQMQHDREVEMLRQELNSIKNKVSQPYLVFRS